MGVLKIRPATQKDNSQILKLLKELDLYYSSLSPKDFWVAEQNEKIVGTVQLEELDDFLFLGSLGVAPGRQKQGIARLLLEKSLKGQRKDVYLYTIIPGFFKKFGFEITATFPPNLPSKERYECEYCHSEKCVCMVRRHGPA